MGCLTSKSAGRDIALTSRRPDLGLLNDDKASVVAFVEKNGINCICKHSMVRVIDKAMQALSVRKDILITSENSEGKRLLLSSIAKWEELMPWILSHPDLNLARMTHAEFSAVAGSAYETTRYAFCRSPLAEAIKGGRIDLAEQFLAKGAPLRELDEVPECPATVPKTIANTNTPAEFAICSGQLDVARYLLGKGCKPRWDRLGDCVPKLENMKLVFQSLGVDFRRFCKFDEFEDTKNLKSPKFITQRTLLQAAARFGAFETLVYLLKETECKQDVLKVLADGKTLVGYAYDGKREHAAMMVQLQESYSKMKQRVPKDTLKPGANHYRWDEVIAFLATYGIVKEVDLTAPRFTAEELQEHGYSSDMGPVAASGGAASSNAASSVPSISASSPGPASANGLPLNAYEWDGLMMLSYLVKKNVFAKPESLEAANENPIVKFCVTGAMAMDATKEDFDELFRDAAGLPVQTRMALWSAICALRREQADKAAEAQAASALAQSRMSPLHAPSMGSQKKEESIQKTFARSAADEAGKYVGSQGTKALFSVLF
eukprot:gene25469-30751_t